ncbi:hypothetical protein FRC16_003516 [Serendipita sp. 398]|nr:hypothetical protein FRC16_003516 [Serendipita sp. 398]
MERRDVCGLFFSLSVSTSFVLIIPTDATLYFSSFPLQIRSTTVLRYGRLSCLSYTLMQGLVFVIPDRQGQVLLLDMLTRPYNNTNVLALLYRQVHNPSDGRKANDGG